MVLFTYFNYSKNYQLLMDKQSKEIALTGHLLQDQMINGFHGAYVDMIASEQDDLKKLYWVADQIVKSKKYSLEDLKKQINQNVQNKTIDIFLINKDYVVFETTYPPDLNLNFHIIPAVLDTLDDIYFGRREYDISKPIYVYGNIDNITLKKYFLIKPKELDFMIQIGITHSSFDGIQTDNAIKMKIPNILSYDLYSVYKNNQTQNLDNFIPILSSNIMQCSKSGMSKNDYYTNELRIGFEKNYEIITGKKYSKDVKLDYAEIINTLKKHNNLFVSNNGATSTLVLPINLYTPYIDKYWQPTKFLIVKIDNTNLIKELRDFQIINILYLGLFVGIFILILLLVYFKILRPLFAMQELMLKKEKINDEMIDDSQNEFGDVMATYNKLFDNLEQEIATNKTLLENLKNFTSNSIHQLKTPMSVMSIYLDMLKSIPKDEEIKDSIKSSILMINHIHDTLSYKLQKDSVQFNPEDVNISDVLINQVRGFALIAKGYDKEIVYEVQANLHFMINKVELSHLIDNNLSNGIKYGASKKPLFVKLEIIGGEIRMTFANEGKEIINKNSIFERFVRESSEAIGQGIGLNLVREIARKYEIKIDVIYENNQNKFIYTFPKKLCTIQKNIQD